MSSKPKKVHVRIAPALLAYCLLCEWTHAQSVPPSGISAATAPAPARQQAVEEALLGDWTGLLTYRDFSQPAESTRRVQLPTWLSIRRQAEGLRMNYIYDDGPGKVVRSDSTLVLDTQAATYRIVGTDQVLENYTIAGLETLRGGHGVLLLTGSGKESGKPVDVRETLSLRRNLLCWLRESRPAGSAEPFAYRHEYTFVRSLSPSVDPQK